MSDALFPKVRQRVLATLFVEPERSFYVNELMRLANSGAGALQRELEGLTSASVITMRRVGNQKHYQANAESPIFNELRAIVAKTSGIVENVRQALVPLASEISWAFLYGSAAKGRLHGKSDIDLLLVSDKLTLEKVYDALAPAETHLARKISPTLYTTKEFRNRRGLGNSFLTKVLGGETITLIGGEDAVT